MCLEDLRLGRGRYVGRTGSLVAGNAFTLAADARRVAIVLSFVGASGYDSGVGAFVADTISVFYGTTATGFPVISLSAPAGLITLRIEDVGQLVQGPVTFLIFGPSGITSGSLVEILTDVRADAIGFN